LKKSPVKAPAVRVVKNIRRKTRRQFSAEDKIRIVLGGLRGEDSIAELCRREGIAQSLYYTWSKEFMEASKRRLAGDTARAASNGDVQDLRREVRALKECMAYLTLENRLLKKKHDRGWGRLGMRYPAAEKLEIIRLVEQSHLPAKQTLDRLGPARRTFYRWYNCFLEGGPEALQDRPSRPGRVWNRIGADIQNQIVEMALEQTELSSRELAVRFTDEKRYFVSEATVYRLLKVHDLITSPAYIVIKAAAQFHTRTTRTNAMWQTDFTYFKIIGWGWLYLSTVLYDYSRYIVAWKLCTTMRPDNRCLAFPVPVSSHQTFRSPPRFLSRNRSLSCRCQSDRSGGPVIRPGTCVSGTLSPAGDLAPDRGF